MHEYSIVAVLVDRVAATVATRPGATVRTVRVRIGELAGVDTALLATAFATFRDRTVCEAAELAIERVPAEWRCRTCGRAIQPGAVLRCCARPARLVAGDDIILERVEMEVPDV